MDIESNIKIFADDKKIYNSFNNVDILQEDLNKLVLWSDKWLLPFNIDKCRVINYGHNNVPHSYLMDGKLVLNINSIKDLGITFDSKLKFDQHINNITTSYSVKNGVH